jgi:hypothetical protein
MAKIYRMSDRIKLKVDDLEVTIGPLSIHQKASVEEIASSASLIKASLEAMKYAIKDIKGLEDKDGKEYKIERDEEGYLTEDALNDIFNLENSYKLVAISLNLVNSIPDEFIDVNTGKPIEGVEFVIDEGKKGKKKKVVSGS